MNPHIPRLHMGCGESLRSHWLVHGLPHGLLLGRKVAVPASVKRKRKPERTRG